MLTPAYLLLTALACGGKRAPDLVTLGPVETVTVHDVSVFPATGPALLAHQDVTLRDGKIAAVGPTGQSPPEGRVIEGAGLTLLPGLVDAHVHLTAPVAMPGTLTTPDPRHSLQAWLAAGVTTVFDMGGPAGMQDRALAKLASGEDFGPRVRRTNSPITVPDGHPIPAAEALLPWPLSSAVRRLVPVIERPEDAEGIVLQAIADGADAIKIICDSLPPGAAHIDQVRLDALVKAAHAHDRRAFVHIGREEDARMAIAAGADALVHGVLTSELSADGAALIAAARVPVVWTGAAYDNTGRLALGHWAPSALDRALHPASLIATMEGGAGLAFGEAPVVGDFGREVNRWREAWPGNVARAQAAGVVILAGSDSPLPADLAGSSIHAELAWLHRMGVPAADVLLGATSRAAALYGDTEYGMVEVGKAADLLLIRGDPLEDIGATQQIVAVWRAGQPVNPADPAPAMDTR